ncbi:MAG: carboxypeptidase-like regulatory domain-containing protein, partial [Planctomycetota bacterium]
EEVVARYDRLGHVEARLWPDRFTIPFSFRFLEPDGDFAKDVTFRIVCVDEPKPGGRSVPDARTGSGHVEPSVRRAWEKHYRLCLTRGGFTEKLVHLGVDSDLFDFKCGPEAAVRFVATGYYGIIARSAAGGFRDQEFQVMLKQEQPFTVQLQKGIYLKGQLLGLPDEKPVARATLLVKEEGQVVHMAQSDAGGRFRIGPWNERRVHLEITHNWYREKTLGPLVAGDQDITVRLQPRPVQKIRGVVRRRPDLQPVAGAEVVVWIAGVEEVTTRSDERGQFVVRSPVQEPQLHIRAKGFVPYQEITSADAGARTYDLLPDTTDARVRTGLTALLSGNVIDSNGRPAAGEPVHIVPRKQPTFPGIHGRRILAGGSLALPRTVFTDRHGRFALEWAHAGDARLIAVKGVVPEDAGRYINVVLGRHQQDIQLILGR